MNTTSVSENSNEILEIKKDYNKLYDEYLQTKDTLNKNYGDEKEKQRRLDLLKYQVNEIEVAKLKENEDEELEDLRKVMLNTEKILKYQKLLLNQ